MDTDRPPEIEPPAEEQLRALGYDPDHLTPLERRELVEILRLWPDTALSA